MRISAGPLAGLPTDRCVSIAAGRAIVARVGDEVAAFDNECLHQASPLAGGVISDGVLVCPLHFWRYHMPDGLHVGPGPGRLRRHAVEILDGEVWVDLPDPQPERSMRDILLDHAAEWDRDRTP